MDQNALKQLQEKIDNAQQIAFLTGAGVSTHSNIPDYRSKNGIYNGVKESPETILSEETLYQRPKFFYDFVMKNMYFPQAKPNLIHQKIAQICNQKGSLITQNIDRLDTQAHNQHVTEFHGNLYHIYCSKCHQTVSYNEYAQGYIHQNCGGILRPDIVLYGEAINPEVLAKSVEIMQQADLIIICGTSFVVYPFAQLLMYQKENAAVFAINQTEIPAPGIHQIIGDALEAFKILH